MRQVLVATGAIPTEVAGESLGLGGECYGVVQRVGAAVPSGIGGVSVGERVVCVPPAGMGSVLVTHSRWVSRAPAGTSAEVAVAGTMAYATAWLGLHMQARVRAGDAVLIHSAAGGVGLAAVHLALRAGCVVYATASTPAKVELLLSIGVTAVFNSRSTVNFSEGVRTATGGAGVDVVLNSLAGEGIEASVALLKPYGILVELGKRDGYEGNAMSLAPFLRAVTCEQWRSSNTLQQLHPPASRPTLPLVRLPHDRGRAQ